MTACSTSVVTGVTSVMSVSVETKICVSDHIAGGAEPVLISARDDVVFGFCIGSASALNRTGVNEVVAEKVKATVGSCHATSAVDAHGCDAWLVNFGEVG